MYYKGKGGKQYTLDQNPFAQGGEGKLYNVIGNPDIVAKIYKNGLNNAEKENKLLIMVDNPPSQQVMSQIAWPLDVLYDSRHSFVGFVMPKLPINEDINVIYEYGASAKYPKITWSNKILIAKNLCAVLGAVHDAGHVVGDLNPKNISVNPNNGRIVFVDTDSYHIEDNGRVYRCNVGIAEYFPAEIQRKLKGGASLTDIPLPTFSMNSDNFALAVHIFQLLMNGTHPFACRVLPSQPSVAFAQPSDNILNGIFPFMHPNSGTDIPLYAPSMDILPQNMKDLFRRAFVVGHKDPNQRPSAEEWYVALEDLQQELCRCPKKSNHEYYKKLSTCPWCEVDQRYSSGKTSPRKTPMVQATFTQTNMPTGHSTSGGGYGYQGGGYNAPQPPTRPIGGYRSKKPALIISIAVVLVLLIGFLGVTAFLSNNKISKVEELISYLPDSVDDYVYYDQEIMDAYSAYMELDPKLQKHVENADKLFACIEGFHIYRADVIRQTLAEVNLESVKNSDVLERLNKLYTELTDEQRNLLTSEEYNDLKAKTIVYEVIRGIQNLMNDAVTYYDTMPKVRSNYTKLSDADKQLVYNYSELDRVDEAYALQSNLTFTELESGGYSIKLKEGASSSIKGTLIIPSEYKGSPVVTIEDYAFQDCRGVTSVVIPNSINTIGIGAFKGCNNIQSMSLPFTGHSNDATAYNAVFGYIFGYETQQKKGNDDPVDTFVNEQYGNVEQATWQYSRINYPYYNSVQSFYYYIPKSIKSVIITNQSEIKDAAFNGCKFIEKIEYSKDVRSIGAAAFQNCELMVQFNSDSEKTFDLTGSVEKIGSYAFANCKSAEVINIASNITTIENNAFDGCHGVRQLDLHSNIQFIGDYAFRNLKLIKAIHVFDSTNIIGKGAFQGCNKVENVTIPFTGRSIDATAYTAVFGYIFGYETQQKKGDDDPVDAFVNEKYGNVEQATWQYSRINYPYYNSVQSFFYYIPTSIKNVTITKQSVVKDAAFNGCKNIISINYDQNITSYGIAAFQGCENLTCLNSDIPGTANLKGESSKLGGYLLKNCTSISDIKMYDGLVIIGEYAFENTMIDEFFVPNSVTNIYIGAVKGCKNISKITVPFIGKSAEASAYEAVLGFIFGYETRQKKGNDDPIDNFVNEQYGNVEQATWQYSRINYPYYNSVQSFYYYIPVSLKTVVITEQTKVPIAAFNGCTMLTTIVFENGVSSQGEAAFQNCSATITK